MLFFPVTYVILLGAALFHGLYGLRTMLFELNPPSVLKRVVAVLILIVGIGLFAYGTWAAVESFWLARSL
jgi:succinate dehydrogenase hydrophobic anchor subunit